MKRVFTFLFIISICYHVCAQRTFFVRVYGQNGVATGQTDPYANWILYTPGEGTTIVILLGLPLGIAIGGITVLFKNSNTFIINGDIDKWKVFQSYTSNRNNKNNKAEK